MSIHEINEKHHQQLLEELRLDFLNCPGVKEVDLEYEINNCPPIDFVIWTDYIIYVGEVKYNDTRTGQNKAFKQIHRNLWNMRDHSELLYGVYTTHIKNHQTWFKCYDKKVEKYFKHGIEGLL